MSKERELLRQSLIALEDGPYGWELMEEIQNLLAQPETKQEPVAWMYDWEDTPNGDGESVLLKDLVTNNISITRMLSLACNVRPLYLAPPTRKPLRSLAIKEAGRNAKDMSFYNGVKWAEQQHGIGVGDE